MTGTFLKTICGGVLLLGLAGCADMASVPLTEQEQQQDQALLLAVRSKLDQDKRSFLEHVEVSVHRGSVWLTGLVFDHEDSVRARADAQAVEGVVSVKEDILVSSNVR